MSELLARDHAVTSNWAGLTEANEVALLAALSAWKADQVLAMRGSYHGRSFGAASVTGNPGWKMSSHSPFCTHYLHGADRQLPVCASPSDADFIQACVGGVMARGDLLDGIRGSGNSTFGGNPLSTAAASVTLDYLLSHDLQRAAAANGALIMSGLLIGKGGRPGDPNRSIAGC